MEYRIAAASRGVAWFQGGVRMLDRNPRGLLAVVLVLALINQIPGFFLGRAPTVGVGLMIAFNLLGPALLGGVFCAIDDAVRGRPVGLVHLFEALRRPGARAQLLVLGAVMLLVWALLGYAAWRILGMDNLRTLQDMVGQEVKPDDPRVQELMLPLLKMFGLAAAVLFVLLVALFFAVPRVLFDGRGALPALGESLAACAANVLPLLVYALVAVGVLLVAAVGLGIVAAFLHLLGSVGAFLQDLLMIGLAMIWTLISTSANYLAWREVFGHSDSAPSQPPPQAGVVL
ncbi:MAG: hypothetical protein JSR34_07565 [Proteobacteria bacterium]|nr:hypothetical protein [Pseudomonadota bacterium]